MTVSTYIIQYFRRSVKNSKTPRPTNSFLMRLWRLPALSASVHSAAGLLAPRFAWDTNFPSLSAVHRKPQPPSSPPRFAEGLKPFSPLLGLLKVSISLLPSSVHEEGPGVVSILLPLAAAKRQQSRQSRASHPRSARHIINAQRCISSARRAVSHQAAGLHKKLRA